MRGLANFHTQTQSNVGVCTSSNLEQRKMKRGPDQDSGVGKTVAGVLGSEWGSMQCIDGRDEMRT